MYPLHCGNISVAKVSPLHTHVVDIWVQGSHAQEENIVNRPDFKKNLLVLASHKKYSKTGVECLRQLVIQLGLQPLGYPISMEGRKLMHVICDAICDVSYEDDAQIKEGDKDMGFNM